jgi:hypothetical protein
VLGIGSDEPAVVVGVADIGGGRPVVGAVGMCPLDVSERVAGEVEIDTRGRLTPIKTAMAA